MPTSSPSNIHVCSLAALQDVVDRTGASHVVTVINPWSMPQTPVGVVAANHLKIAVNDIEEPQSGLVAPDDNHIAQLLDFVAGWQRDNPMVIHCLAGISRSSAAAFIAICALNDAVPELTIARALRSASKTASPNRLMVKLADQQMRRNGRMIAAVEDIGVGEHSLGGRPFSIPSSML